MDILQACALKKQEPFKLKAPKAHQLQTKEVYAQEDSICSQSEELTSSNESFCLQARIQYA